MPGIDSLLSDNPVGAGVSAGLGAVDAAVGLVNEIKLKKEANALNKTRPTRTISPEVLQNLGLTESELAGGLGAAASKAYNDEADRQQAGSLSAILRGGGSVNNVADVYGRGEEGRQRLAIVTNQMRLNQIRNLMSARENMTNEEDKNFLFNKWMPYADKAQAIGQQRQAANKQIWSGLQTLTGGVSDFFGAKANPGTDTTTNPMGVTGGYSTIGANVRTPSAVMATGPSTNPTGLPDDFFVPQDNSAELFSPEMLG